MNTPAFFALGLCFTLLVACSNVSEVTGTGASVPDQLNSRGSIATPSDTLLPIDSTGQQALPPR